MRKHILLMLSGCSLVLCQAGSAAAQTPPRCTEGKTLSGECVNPGLALAMRKTVIAFTQPKLSYTSPPHLPREDRSYSTASDHHEITNLFSFGRILTASEIGSVRP